MRISDWSSDVCSSDLEVNARGRPLRELATLPATAGDTVRLTVDGGLQSYAARRLGDHSGSVVIMDCTNGDILAMTSMPAYDPNAFSGGIRQTMRSEEHTSELQSLMRILYAVICLKKKTQKH